MRHQRLLEALRRRVIEVTKSPQYLIEYSGDIANKADFIFPTFYKATVELGLMKEAEARQYNMVVPNNFEFFESRALMRSFNYMLKTTAGLPVADREEALRPYGHALTSGDAVTRLSPDQLLTMLRGLMHVRSEESYATEPLLATKNFLMSHLCTRLAFLQPMDIAELFTMMSKLGKSCVSLDKENISRILEVIEEEKASFAVGAIVGALVRSSRSIEIPSPQSEQFVAYALDCAKNETCGAQHQVTILRAIVTLETILPERFPPGKGSELLDIIREKGMLSLEGPNLGMMLSILARLNKTDDPLIETVLEAVMPQLDSCKAVTLIAIVRNAAYLGLHLPGRLAEAVNRAAIRFIDTEPLDSLLAIFYGACKVCNSSPKSRKLLMAGITRIVQKQSDTMTMEEYAKLTRCLAMALGSQRTRAPRDTHEGALISEIDLEALDHILMRVLSVPRSCTWAVVDVMRNLAELGIDYEEMKPLAHSVVGEQGQLDTNVLERLIKALQLANCTDALLIRAVASTARKSKSAEIMALADQVIANIE